MNTTLTFASRPSALARWQTEFIIQNLRQAWPALECAIEIITTQGDRILDRPLPEIGGKGLFTAELESALLEGRVDAAVHSLKDLPTEDSPGLTIGVIPKRVNPRDAWICPAGYSLKSIPQKSIIGTSSNRRAAQILGARPDLIIKPIRGNVDTRLKKVQSGEYDAIVLAAAGLIRLGFDRYITEILPLEIMLPAPGQGALAVQCRSQDDKVLKLLSALEHPETRKCVTAERAFLAALGGGCSLPIGAHGSLEEKEIILKTVQPANHNHLELVFLEDRDTDPLLLGRRMAEQSLSQNKEVGSR